MASTTTPTLRVVIRGATHRVGNEHSRNVNADPLPQNNVLLSFEANILEPARRLNWSIDLCADVEVPREHRGSLLERLSLLGVDNATRLSVRPLARLQLLSLQRSLEWCYIQQGQQPWDALLVWRIDLEMKQPLHIPAPGRVSCDIIVPFQCFDDVGRTRQGHPLVSDALFWVPWCRYAEWMRALERRLNEGGQSLGGANDTRVDRGTHWHDLCDRVSDVSYFEGTRHKANSARDWNPLYRMTGRAEAAKGVWDGERLMRGVACRATLTNATKACRVRCGPPRIRNVTVRGDGPPPAADDGWLGEALAHGLRWPRVGVPVDAAAPSEVCVSLVAYEDAQWIDALLANAARFTTARIALHLNRLSTYDDARLAAWNGSHGGRVALTAERIVVAKAYGSILYAHLLNARTLAWRWPTACRLVVLQASNMLWLRRGMERRAARFAFSLDARELARYVNTSTEVARHLVAQPLYRALTTARAGRPAAFPMSYHEGSFWPLTSLLAFRDFMARALRASPGGGGLRGGLAGVLSRAANWPEELWLQAYVANHDPSYALALARGPLFSLAVGQLCWRGKAHFPNGTSRPLVEAISDGTLKGGAQFFASKVQRGLADPVTRWAAERWPPAP